jgi:hypothetical protein
MKPAGAVLALLTLFAVATFAIPSIAPASAATMSHSLRVFAGHAGWDCVTKDGDFCAGEMTNQNGRGWCVTSTTCTDAQLAECLPGVKKCSQVTTDQTGPVGQAGD